MAVTETRQAPPDVSGDGPEPVASRRTWPVLCWLTLLPTLGFLFFGSTGRDDVYITYWAADQLRQTGRITNYNGQALEQSSSLLHVLLLAAASWSTRLPVTSIGPWLAVAAGALCAPVAYKVCGRLDARGQWAAAALVGTLPPLVYWSFGGLETSIATFLVLLALLVTIAAAEGASGRLLRTAGALLAVVLVRPEMGIVFATALLGAGGAVRLIVPPSWRGTSDWGRDAAARRLLLVAVGVAGILLLISGIRRWYFGSWVPRPVSMKAGTPHIALGLQYAWATAVQSRTFLALGFGSVLVALRWRTLTPGWIIAACVVATGTIAIVVAGGDWMEGGRLLAPWMAVALVLVGASLGRLSASRRFVVATSLIVANVAGLVTYAERCSTGMTAWTTLEGPNEPVPEAASAPLSTTWWERRNAVHARDILFVRGADPILAALARVVRPRRVTYASGQAGMTIYYLQQNALRRGQPFQFIDRAGLTDDSWDGCRQGMASGPTGKLLSWNRVLSERCGPLPDVVSDLFPPALLTRAYTLFYEQPMRMWPGEHTIVLSEWLAVRNDLAAPLRAELRRESQNP